MAKSILQSLVDSDANINSTSEVKALDWYEHYRAGKGIYLDFTISEQEDYEFLYNKRKEFKELWQIKTIFDWEEFSTASALAKGGIITHFQKIIAAGKFTKGIWIQKLYIENN